MARSFWLATKLDIRFAPLAGDVTVDVAVVGGGITGVTTALLLKQAGNTVALVELRRVGAGVSGNTTAKLTSGHGLQYAKLIRKHGAEVARVYAESNEAGLAKIAELVQTHAIECDFERSDNFVYGTAAADAADLREEARAAQEAGLDADFVGELAFPFPVTGAVRLRDQVQFHPAKYLAALAELIDADGSHVFQETRALGVETGSPSTVNTSGGTVRADDVVVATHLPFLDRGLYFAKAHPQMSYAVAAPVESPPEGMYLSISEPTRSIRTTPHGGSGCSYLVARATLRAGKETPDSAMQPSSATSRPGSAASPNTAGRRMTTSPSTDCRTSVVSRRGQNVCMLRPGSPSGV